MAKKFKNDLDELMDTLSSKKMAGVGPVNTEMDLNFGRLHPIGTTQRYTPPKGRGIQLQKPYNFVGAKIPGVLRGALKTMPFVDAIGGIAQIIGQERDITESENPKFERKLREYQNLNKANLLSPKEKMEYDLMNTNYAGGGKITTSGRVRDFLHKTVGIPMAVNQLGYDVSGGQSPITENSLTNEELSYLRGIVRKNLKGKGAYGEDGKNKIQYGDYNETDDHGDTDGWKESLKQFNNIPTNLKYTLGRANINISNGDTTIVDKYNFNDTESYKNDSFIDYLKDAKSVGISDPYNQARIIGSYFGSDEQHGSPVNIKINQKANGGKLTDEELNAKIKIDRNSPEWYDRSSGKVEVTESPIDYLSSLPKIGIQKTLGRILKKIIPETHAPSSDYIYRGIGKSGLEDAKQSGVIRQSGFDSGVPKYKTIYYGSGEKGLSQADRYGRGIVAAIKKDKLSEPLTYRWAENVGTTNEQIPINNVEFLKKGFFGYKNFPIKANGGHLNTNDMNNEYKSGGSIHINPANRGKFNRTKAQTGKSNEELTHSKNPLTRKRAIFAQNASRWNHADGGDLSLPQLGGLPEDKLYGGGNIFFLGGETPPKKEPFAVSGAMQGVGSVAGFAAGMIPTETRGGAAAAGALSGASAGMALGPWGALAGAAIGGGLGYLKQDQQMKKDDWNETNADMKQRNSMLGIKAKGGIIFPLGVNQTQVTNYAKGGQLTEFNTGGSHEQNANGGILQGVDENGTPNKVEQGETKWNDYIFSDRLTVDDNLIQSHNLPEKYRGKTFADASKTMNKALKERPNDPIARNTMATNMEALQAANDQEIARTNQIEQQKQFARGGNLYKNGGLEEFLTQKANEMATSHNYADDEVQPEFLPIDQMGNRYKESYGDMFSSQNKGSNTIQSDNVNTSLTGQNLPIAKSSSSTEKWWKNSDNLRYAPTAFNAIAGLVSKTPKSKEYSPTLIRQQGQLQAPRIDEQSMRNAIDAGYQNQIRGLSDASGGSGAAMRAGMLGAGDNYMSALGQGFMQANQVNNQSKMAADQFNLQAGASNASQNAQMINQANQYNTQTSNARDLANYETKMSYLGQSAQDLGEIGKENRFAKIMPKVYGYDQYGNYKLLQGDPQQGVMPKLPGEKKCGGKLKLRMKK